MIDAPLRNTNAEFAADPFRRNYRIVIFFVLLALCCFLRLWDLGYKSLMHDETLFVTYTYENLYKKWDYLYQPILHGPLMLLWQDLVFHVFGPSDYTARLGCALLGIFSFFFVWKMRYWLGEAGTWFALLFYSLSPGIAFFHRFFHNDALFLFNTLWIVCSFANWWRTRSGWWAVSALLAITALFTNKASAVVVYFTLFTFFLLYVIHDFVAYVHNGKSLRLRDFLTPAPKFPAVLLVATILVVAVALVLTQSFEGISFEPSVVAASGHDFPLKNVHSVPLALNWPGVLQAQLNAPEIETTGFWQKFYAALILGSLAAAAFLKFSVDRRAGHTEFLTHLWRLIVDNRLHVVGGLFLCLFFYLAVYTTFFTYSIGPFEIYKQTWAYWGGQHDIGRIEGPFTQHMTNILLYETPSLLIIVFAWFLGLFRIRWTHSTGYAFIFMFIAAAAFHKLIFSGLQDALNDGGALALMNINFMKPILLFLLTGFIASLVSPKLGRVILPIALIALVVYSVAYFSTDAWAKAMETPIYRDGVPVILKTRHATLAQSMEVRFNFDGGSSLAIVLVLVFFATIHTWHALEKGERFHAFLVWWAVTATGAASYAREAVPQVGIHAMMPTILLAASYVNKFYTRPHSRALHWIAACSLGLMFLYSTKATFNLNLRNADDPRERMAYGPSNRDVKSHIDFVLQYAAIASLKKDDDGRYHYLSDYNDIKNQKDVRIYMRPLDQVTWPAKWYFRNLAYTEGSDPSIAINEDWDFLFLEPADEEKFPALKEKYHIMRARGTTFWTPNTISPSSLVNVWKNLIPGHYLSGVTKVEADQSKLDWYRIWRYLAFRETYEGTDRPYPAVSSFEYIFCYRKDMF
ncbi:glycosyltransferase family 39 protein [Candidatus Sumerlaeota bacterium]|nr:glycosyltransferase family 39 protein [Candidatus Sumerlaeota bacterium]